MMKTFQQNIEALAQNIEALAEDYGLRLAKKYVGAVKVGDYLIYEVTEYEQNPYREEGVLQSVKRTYCRRVVATGGEQGSGPTPGQNWLAMEGDDRIRKYGDRREDEVVVLEPDETFKGHLKGGGGRLIREH